MKIAVSGERLGRALPSTLNISINYFHPVSVKGTVSRYIDKNRTGACGLGRNRRLLRHTELVFLSTVCARRVVLVLFTNMDATIVVN